MTTRKTTKSTKTPVDTTDSLMKDFTVADEKRWEGMSIEELEALSEHNQNILSGYEATVITVKKCQNRIADIIRAKRHSAIMEKIDAITPEQRFDILDRIPHSKNCPRALGKFQNREYTGFYVNASYNDTNDTYTETPKVECPHCALKYVLNNSWLGIDFVPSVEFDFTEYDGGLL